MASLFPNLSCYAVVDADTLGSAYALVVGLHGVVILDVDIDYAFGNKDGRLDLPEFEGYLAHYGYTQRVDCGAAGSKVAVFGRQVNGASVVLHAAISEPARVGDGKWWRSKLGLGATIVHRLEDIRGPTYGDVLGCYEKAS